MPKSSHLHFHSPYFFPCHKSTHFALKYRFMKQLGSSVDNVLGLDDDDEKKNSRRGSKDKKCTPLKEKLHKSWGGRVRVA